jgi:ATP-dependent DNA helicase DinG
MNTKENNQVILRKLINDGIVSDDSVLIKVIKDTVLIERFTGKSYTYKAVNYINGASKHLFHKKTRYNGERIDIEEYFKKFEAYEMTYPTSGEEMVQYIFEQVFTTFGYSIRKEQVDLSIQMYRAMVNKKISISDVPVGLGKTHAYLVAAITHSIIYRCDGVKSSPVILTTSSIELQKAIVKDYLPDISNMLLAFGIINRSITSVIRKGKDNYLCDQRLENYIKNLDPRKKKLDELLILRQIEEMDEIDLDEINGISAYDRRRISVNYNACHNCKKHDTCRYQRFMKRVKRMGIQVQVCNHNYYLADVIRRRNGLSRLLPVHNVIVIDEAHKLNDAARQMYGTTVSQRELKLIPKYADPIRIKDKDARQLHQLSNDVNKFTSLLFKVLINNIPKDIDRNETEKFETILSPVGKVYLSRIISSLEEIYRLTDNDNKKLKVDIKRNIRNLKSFLDWSIIYWLENPFMKNQCLFVSVPIALNRELGIDLWQKDDSKILTSGTIAVQDDFSYFKQNLGMSIENQSRISEISKPTPFNYEENCLLHISENLPYPKQNDDKYIESIANKIESLIKVSNGHAMVLFTSYKTLKKVYGIIKPKLKGFDLILMSRGKSNAINEFKKTKNGILLATGSAWEGVNIPDDLLSHLIVVKLPFPIPDPISEYERMMYPVMEDFIDAVAVPQMLIKLRQGVGRLIRSESDSGVISILDARASSRGRYHNQVIEALPSCRLVKNETEIETFLINKKASKFWNQ